MAPELQEAFAYITTSKALWATLKEKYGQCNGMFLSQLKKVISRFKQKDLSLTNYYTHLQTLMNELDVKLGKVT